MKTCEKVFIWEALLLLESGMGMGKAVGAGWRWGMGWADQPVNRSFGVFQAGLGQLWLALEGAPKVFCLAVRPFSVVIRIVSV